METIEMLRKRMFQSLIGRLKTDRGVLTADRVRAFQSLIGRLKTACSAGTGRRRIVPGFNPS